MASRSIYKIIFAAFFIFSSVNIYASNSFKDTVSELKFINLFVKDDPDVIDYIDPSELQQSNRLGITYANTPIKFLLNYTLPEDVREQITVHGEKFHASVHQLEDNYTFVDFYLHNKSYLTQFYFKDGKCVSPMAYFARNFARDSSEYFDFYISNPVHFNNYSKNELDEFAKFMLDIMNFTEDEKNYLKENKIIYVLCDNDEEMKNITWMRARGIYLVANDAVATTYPVHNHEVAHLLMNYRIKTNIQPAHYFFLEGFATAFGGRGGLSTLVLQPIAEFSLKSGFVNLNSLLSMRDFAFEDASITYPVAGLYSIYSILNYGFDKYLEDYLRFSGSYDYISKIDSTNIVLPYEKEFMDFVRERGMKNLISIEVNKNSLGNTTAHGTDYKFYKKDNDYLILLKNKLLLKDPRDSFEYISKIFTEKFPDKTYLNYKYLIEADENKINIYDLYSDILILSYNKGFDIQQRSVPKDDGYFMFSVGGMFDTGLENFIIETLD